MEGVKRGGDRQELHERVRVHSMAAGRTVKIEGGDNDLLDRIAADDSFGMDREALDALAQPRNYIGRANHQVREFLAAEVDPLLARFGPEAEPDSEPKV
jgi:adenylosuccinate lyase